MCNLSEGIEREGRVLGALQASLEAAKNMLKDGLSLSKIKQYLPDLTDEDLKKVQEDVAHENKE